MITSIVEDDDHTAAARAMRQQLPQKALEGLGIEYLAHPTDEFPGAQVDSPEAGDGLARRCVQQDGVLVLWRDPHPTARTVLLEVTFAQAPQFNVGPSSEAAEFFYRRDFQRISLSDLGTRLA
jgi:hypothetical protein